MAAPPVRRCVAFAFGFQFTIKALEPLIGHAGTVLYPDGVCRVARPAFQFPRHYRHYKTSNMKFIDTAFGLKYRIGFHPSYQHDCGQPVSEHGTNPSVNFDRDKISSCMTVRHLLLHVLPMGWGITAWCSVFYTFTYIAGFELWDLSMWPQCRSKLPSWALPSFSASAPMGHFEV